MKNLIKKLMRMVGESRVESNPKPESALAADRMNPPERFVVSLRAMAMIDAGVAP